MRYSDSVWKRKENDPVQKAARYTLNSWMGNNRDCWLIQGSKDGKKRHHCHAEARKNYPEGSTCHIPSVPPTAFEPFRVSRRLVQFDRELHCRLLDERGAFPEKEVQPPYATGESTGTCRNRDQSAGLPDCSLAAKTRFPPSCRLTSTFCVNERGKRNDG